MIPNLHNMMWRMPAITHRNRVWTYHDLAQSIKTQAVHAALQQSGSILKNVLFTRKPKLPTHMQIMAKPRSTFNKLKMRVRTPTGSDSSRESGGSYSSSSWLTNHNGHSPLRGDMEDGSKRIVLLDETEVVNDSPESVEQDDPIEELAPPSPEAQRHSSEAIEQHHSTLFTNPFAKSSSSSPDHDVHHVRQLSDEEKLLLLLGKSLG